MKIQKNISPGQTDSSWHQGASKYAEKDSKNKIKNVISILNNFVKTGFEKG